MANGESLKKRVATAGIALLCLALGASSASAGESHPLPGPAKRLPDAASIGQTRGASPSAASAHASIIKGVPAPISALPWLAYVEYRGRIEGFACSGSVIAPRVVLTAGHCVLSEGGGLGQPSGYTVITGASNLGVATPSNASQVVQALIYPGYDPTKARDDAGLLILSAPVAAPPLPLATPAEAGLYSPGTPITIAGWGYSHGDASRPSIVLRKAETVIQSAAYCKQKTSRVIPFYSPTEQLCASSPPKYEFGSCHGDSGGPGIAQRADGTPVQVGIISLGAPGCSTRVPEVQTRVDRISAWAASWISAIEQGTPAPAVRIPRVVLPRLSLSDAKLYAFFGLAEDFRSRFLHGKGLGMRCRKIDREKAKCSVIWFQGPNDYYGTITIYYALAPESPFWEYRYRIHWVNDRCWFHSGHRASCPIHAQFR